MWRARVRIGLLILTVAVIAYCSRPAPEISIAKVRGAVLAHVHTRGKGYGSGASAPLLAKLSQEGINLIQLNPFGYQPSVSDRRILYDDPTLSDDNLKREIAQVHQKGMMAMLAPHIWLDRHDNAPWRSQLTYSSPNEVAEWFASYEKFILHYARIAHESKVEFFAVGVELEALAKNTNFFRQIIRRVRDTGYRGLLTYECEAWNSENIAFWDELDFVGVNMYYSFDAEPRDAGEVDFKRLIEFQRQKLDFHASHAQRVKRPWIITEFGYPAHNKAISQTSTWPDSMRVRDDLAQHVGFHAMEKALAHPVTSGAPGASGIIFWKYVTTLDSYEKASYATDFIMQGKPAEKILFRMAHRLFR